MPITVEIIAELRNRTWLTRDEAKEVLDALEESLREKAAPEGWHVGSKVPLNVYEGSRPVCQCHNEEDARRIVAAIQEEARLREALHWIVVMERDTRESLRSELPRWMLMADVARTALKEQPNGE